MLESRGPHLVTLPSTTKGYRMSILYSLSFRLPLTRARISLLPAVAHQLGMWIERQSQWCTVVGMGKVLMFIERGEGPLLRVTH